MQLEPIQRLTKDLKTASIRLSDDEARFLVDSYYQMQDDRKRSDNQVRSMSDSTEPCDVLMWLADQSRALENQVKRALDAYSGAHPVGHWARAQSGIGPVIAAGLLAHIDIHKAPTAGHIWNFAGLNPGLEWNKGEKRPWNADLKTLCWKVGESFVKVSGKPDAFYGQVYVERKQLEIRRNENMEFADQAADVLKKKRIGKDTKAYKSYSKGKLPDAHIHARAKRFAVKLFLSHLHHVWHVHEFDTEPPVPYAIAHLGHAHYIKPPRG